LLSCTVGPPLDDGGLMAVAAVADELADAKVDVPEGLPRYEMDLHSAVLCEAELGW
jgi:hypothetical protein